jgi:hypothetical protein
MLSQQVVITMRTAPLRYLKHLNGVIVHPVLDQTTPLKQISLERWQPDHLRGINRLVSRLNGVSVGRSYSRFWGGIMRNLLSNFQLSPR